MAAPKPNGGNHRIVLGLLGFLMVSHMSFLGFAAKTCSELVRGQPTDGFSECRKSGDVFQRAAETYVAILLALMTPLAPK